MAVYLAVKATDNDPVGMSGYVQLLKTQARGSTCRSLSEREREVRRGTNYRHKSSTLIIVIIFFNNRELTGRLM